MAANVWKQKPSLDPNKFKVTKLGNGQGWTATRIGGGTSTPKPAAPKTPAGTTLPYNETPSAFVNRSGVVGGWKDIPTNMNPNDWEFQQNRAGKWFARPVDEFTGLDQGTINQVNAFDRDTTANSQFLRSRTDVAGTNANADAEAAAKRMQALTGLIQGSGGNPEIAGAQGRLTVAQAALADRDNSRGVGLARDAAETRLANYEAARRNQRGAGLLSARNAVQQAQVEQAKFQYQQEKDAKDLAARLRGQSLGLLSDKLQIEGQNQRAQLSADTDIATTNATLRTRLEIEAAKLQLQAQKLAEKGNEKQAAAKRKQAAAKIKASNKAKADATQMIDELWVGPESKAADGSLQKTFYEPGEILTIVSRRFPMLNKEQLRSLIAQRSQYAGQGSTGTGYQDYFMRNPFGVR